MRIVKRFLVRPLTLRKLAKKQIVIIMMGYSCSGKSSFARNLCQRFKWLYQNPETAAIKKFGSPHVSNDKDYELVNKIMDKEFVAAIKSGRSVVRDNSHASLEARQRIYDLIVNTPAVAIVVWMKVSHAEALKRRAELTKQRFRHKQGLYYQVEKASKDQGHDLEEISKACLDDFDKYCAHPTNQEFCIEISGRLPLDQQYRLFLDVCSHIL